jgi:hypothetical protein
MTPDYSGNAAILKKMIEDNLILFPCGCAQNKKTGNWVMACHRHRWSDPPTEKEAVKADGYALRR